MKDPDLKTYRTFNDFFTRELKDGARPVHDISNSHSLVSPCDGKVLSYGKVGESEEYTIDCIKGHSYPLDEFLFGFKADKKASPGMA